MEVFLVCFNWTQCCL